jgi:uncharacterized membrane protein
MSKCVIGFCILKLKLYYMRIFYHHLHSPPPPPPDVKIFYAINMQVAGHFHNLTWFPFAVGVRLILTKLKCSPFQGKLMQLILLTNCVITHTVSIKNLGFFKVLHSYFNRAKFWHQYIHMGPKQDIFVLQ